MKAAVMRQGWGDLRYRNKGFTLIELMIVLVIVAVTLTLVGPGFRALNLVTRIKSYGNEFVSDVHLARSEAIKRNGVVRLCVRNTSGDDCQGSGDWVDGWIVIDSNDLVLRVAQAKPSEFEMTNLSGYHTLSFDPSGARVTSTGSSGSAISVSTIRICQKNPVGHQKIEIRLSATGRPSLKREDSNVCPGS